MGFELSRRQRRTRVPVRFAGLVYNPAEYQKGRPIAMQSLAECRSHPLSLPDLPSPFRRQLLPDPVPRPSANPALSYIHPACHNLCLSQFLRSFATSTCIQCPVEPSHPPACLPQPPIPPPSLPKPSPKLPSPVTSSVLIPAAKQLENSLRVEPEMQLVRHPLRRNPDTSGRRRRLKGKKGEKQLTCAAPCGQP